MNTLLLMTNADAAKTLTLVAWVLMFFILLNIALFVYIAIKRKRAEGHSISLSSPSGEHAGEKEDATETDKSGSKAFSLFRKNQQAQGCEIVLTDMAHPERAFYASGKTEFLVGRRPQMDLCIPDDGYVSGTHCRFEIEEGRLYLTDLDSSNGTKVNGNKISERTRIAENDIVRIGKAEYKVDFQ